jgi:hypothetical protein
LCSASRRVVSLTKRANRWGVNSSVFTSWDAVPVTSFDYVSET